MRTDYINSDLYHKIYLRMSYENALALRTSLETGMRIGDVLALRVENLKGRTITYTAQKTGKRGKSVVSVDLANRLRKIAGKRFLFEGRSGDKPRTRQAVWKDVKQATRGMFTENVAPHSARKTFAVEDFRTHGFTHTQKALQHDSSGTTMLYAFADMLTNKKSAPQDVDAFAHKIAYIVLKEFERMFELTNNNGSVILSKKEVKTE
jgi:integrase